MHNILVYGGKDLSDFGVYITNAGIYAFPSRSYDTQVIKGRHGSLILENDRYENVSVTYPAVIYKNFKENMDGMMSYLLAQKGYSRIEDDFRPEHFRLGTYAGATQSSVNARADIGTFSLTFDCKPQLYLKSGNTTLEYTSGGVLINPTDQEARPLIRAYGTGSITLGGTRLTISSASGYTDLDCELMDAYKGSMNCNRNVSGDFPAIKPGKNTLTLSGISRVEITPRFWTL